MKNIQSPIQANIFQGSFFLGLSKGYHDTTYQFKKSGEAMHPDWLCFYHPYSPEKLIEQLCIITVKFITAYALDKI